MSIGRIVLCGTIALAGWLAGAEAVSRNATAGDTCSALVAPAGTTFDAPPHWMESESLPRHCRVRGTIDGRVGFEMRLPARWNGRFLMAGCGGFCGELMPDKPGHANSINEALKRGYAAISHDSGHRAASWETDWAEDREALELWAHKVLPVVAGTGTQLVQSMYGKAPLYRYFSGCSNGGRLGLIAAQRYPDLFDGIAAGGSIFDLSGTAGLWGNWLITTNQPGTASLVPQPRAPLISRLVTERCDRLDGVEDGIVADPLACRLDFRDAVCTADAATRDQCLSAQEADVLNRLYGGVRNGRGAVVYPSLAFGSEHYADVWLFGTQERPAWGVLASAGYRRLLAASLSEPDAPAGLPTDEMQAWIGRSSVPELTDAKDPDLSGLRRAGGKLLIYQGWADPLIIPQPIMDYYRRAADVAGGLERLRDSVRLFMVPGWGHCWERPANAPDQFDPLQELEQWVERGRAPDYIIARQLEKDGTERRSRPICSYPSTARLRQGKDPDRYQSYACDTRPRVRPAGETGRQAR